MAFAAFTSAGPRAGLRPPRRPAARRREAGLGAFSRSVDNLVQAMGMSGVSKSQVSRLCEDIDVRLKAFLDRPIEGDWPHLWVDATYIKVRQNGRIVSGRHRRGRRQL